ncbi:MAG: class I SAM-dependent methyltransferase [Gemmatimonadetes bacterium]|nr:class I SAM-dependent methyltransferase [Gemmatimonadota bacterium]
MNDKVGASGRKVTRQSAESKVAQGILQRIRSVVATRSELADLLTQLARSMPKRVFRRTDLPAEEFLEIYLDEARYLFEVVLPYLGRDVRILEVGGGLGLFHVLALAAGANIVSLEPGAAGFSLFRKFGLELITELTGEPERFVDGVVEELPWDDNEFDLVVSSNVLEHVSDPARAVCEMYRVVRPGGRLLHSCPNYLFPYEPHYKVPVLPCGVKLSGRALWRGFRKDPMWESLNNINALMVTRVARSLPGARLRFHDAMRLVLKRLGSEKPLATRHGLLGRLVLMAPVSAMLRALPAQLLTPMIFEIQKDGGGIDLP